MQNDVLVLEPEQMKSIKISSISLPSHQIQVLYPDLDERLCHQIKHYGVLQPLPVLQVDTGCYYLLAGYPYLAALTYLHYQDILCQVSPLPQKSINAFALQILHPLSAVAASPVLQGYLLQKAQQCLDEPEQLHLLELMGHKPHLDKIRELTALLHLPQSTLLALHQGILSLKTGKTLCAFQPTDQKELTEVIRQYRPGGSKQQKLVEMLFELTKRYQCSISHLINAWQATRQEKDPDNLPQQLQHLLTYLQQQCTPHLVQAEQQFQKDIQELAPPVDTHIQHSPSFEDESITLSLHLDDMKALRQIWPLCKQLIAASRKDNAA